MQKHPIPIVICGATGRMGKALIALALLDERFSLVGACTSPHNPLIGQDIGMPHAPLGVVITSSLAESMELAQAKISKDTKITIVDFSVKEECIPHCIQALKHQVPLLICTTGLENEHREYAQSASQTIPILIAPNTSLGANILCVISAYAKKALPRADVHIVEMHHKNKRDKPSGTAKALLEAMKSDDDAPPPIPVHSIRAGHIPGEHTVYMWNAQEALELTHRIYDHHVFAAGALHAIEYLAHQPPGLYDMLDVLGLPSFNEKSFA